MPNLNGFAPIVASRRGRASAPRAHTRAAAWPVSWLGPELPLSQVSKPANSSFGDSSGCASPSPLICRHLVHGHRGACRRSAYARSSGLPVSVTSSNIRPFDRLHCAEWHDATAVSARRPPSSPRALRILRVVGRQRRDLVGLVLAVAEHDVAVQVVAVRRQRPFETDERGEEAGALCRSAVAVSSCHIEACMSFRPRAVLQRIHPGHPHGVGVVMPSTVPAWLRHESPAPVRRQQARVVLVMATAGRGSPRDPQPRGSRAAVAGGRHARARHHRLPSRNGRLRRPSVLAARRIRRVGGVQVWCRRRTRDPGTSAAHTASTAACRRAAAASAAVRRPAPQTAATWRERRGSESHFTLSSSVGVVGCPPPQACRHERGRCAVAARSPYDL